jgi:hypothetical protein
MAGDAVDEAAAAQYTSGMRAFVALLALSGALAGCTASTSSTPTPAGQSTEESAPAASAAAASATAASTVDATAGRAPGAPHWFKTPGGPRDVVVVYTASVQGYVEPCGCTGDPLGGLARLGALLHEARAAWGDRVVFVDGGDLLFEKPGDSAPADRCQAEARTNLLVGTYARLGLVATTRGALDDVRGAPFRAALLGGHHVPSLDDGRGLVVVRGGIRVLVVGADAETPTAAVQATVDAHTAGGDDAVDLVVLLLQANHARSKALAAALRGVDLVIVGRAAEGPVAPERAGTATVVSAGWQAQRAGVVVAHLEGRDRGASSWTPLALDDRQARADARRQLLDVRIAALDEQLAATPPGDTRAFHQRRRDGFVAERDALMGVGVGGVAPAPTHAPLQAPLQGPHLVVQALPLRRGSPEEPTAARDLQAYLRSIPTLVGACERDVRCPEPPEGSATYVGVATCAACHAAAVEHWQQAIVQLEATNHDGSRQLRPVGHARAWQTLADGGRDRDRSCVGCHATGFDEPGGACTTTQLVQRGLTGVQCESCHGPGSLHVMGGGDKTKIRRDVDESTCRGCHVPPHIETVESFVFSDRLRVILGAGHGADRLRALPPPTTAAASPGTPAATTPSPTTSGPSSSGAAR